MSHDAPMVAAVLGILKAGQIVVGLDPSDPARDLKCSSRMQSRRLS